MLRALRAFAPAALFASFLLVMAGPARAERGAHDTSQLDAERGTHDAAFDRQDAASGSTARPHAGAHHSLAVHFTRPVFAVTHRWQTSWEEASRAPTRTSRRARHASCRAPRRWASAPDDVPDR